MKIKQILKEESLLIESGIRIPKNSKAAKIIHHADLDGIASAIVTREQLIRQGIPAKNITTQMIQYGGDSEGILKKFKVSKGQMLNLVDFAGVSKTVDLPIQDKDEKKIRYKEGGSVELKGGWTLTFRNGKAIASKDGKSVVAKHYGKDGNYKEGEAIKVDQNLKAPDFWSDHHILPHGATDLHKEAGGGSIGKTEYGSDTEHIVRVNTSNLMDGNDVTAITGVDSAKFDEITDNITLRKEFEKKGRLKRLAIILNSLISQLIKRNPTAIKELIKEAKPSVVSMYNLTIKYSKLNNKQIEALEELKKENPDWSKVDSIRNILPFSMAKETTKETAVNKRGFGSDADDPTKITRAKTKSREELSKKGEEDVENAKKSYWTGKQERELGTLKTELAELKKQIKGLKESSKEDVENRIKEIESKIKELEATKKESKSRFMAVNSSTLRQDATSLKDYPGRYVGSVLTKKDGTRYPFTIKRFSSMLQIAANPDLPKEEKEKYKIDLNADMRDILKKAEGEFKTRQNSWAWEKISQESGGHASITNITGINMLGLMEKPKRIELEQLKEQIDRVKNLSKYKKASTTERKKILSSLISADKLKRFEELEKEKKEVAGLRAEVLNFIEKEFYKTLREKYGSVKVDKPIKNQEKYVKEGLKNFFKEIKNK